MRFDNPSPAALLRRLWGHLAAQRRWLVGLLLASMLASGLAEVASVAAVIPLLSVLADPSRLWNHPWVGDLAVSNGLTHPRDLLLPVTLLFGVSAIASALIRMATLWLSGQVSAAIGSDLSLQVYRRTLYQPYGVHTARNSSTIISAVTTHVDKLIHGILYPLIQIGTNTLVIACIVIGLLAIEPNTAALTLIVFAAFYGFIAFLTRSQLLRNSRLQAEHNAALVKTVQEGLGGIRDVLLERSQPYYVDRYRENDMPLRRLWAQAEFLGGFPRFVIEGLGMAGIAILAYIFAFRPGGIATALPMLGTLALAAQRLLPAVQQSYFSFSHMRSHNADLNAIIDLLEQPAPVTDPPPVLPTPFHESIALANVSFRYTPATPLVLRRIDLRIAKGDRVAIVGATGSGKSTLVDLLMGLLPPTEGNLLVDGRRVYSEAWQGNIAHVPQAIFLADTTIAKNIAMAIPAEEIDSSRLRFAAAQAQISDFIESLPQGYDTMVGERGIRLSGGQRQRLGIARALYKSAAVLFFDEATSALDDATERALMETLDQLTRDLTIVMIAHRLSTTQYCNRVIHVANGGTLETTRPGRR